jgi:hypothetical protein
MKTVKVLFIKEYPSNSICAVFPSEKYGFNGYRNDLVSCYSHIGQHSGCAPEYYKDLPLATKDEYQELHDELISIGYKLKVLDSKP